MGCLEIMLQNICLSEASTATWPRPHPGDFCISTKRKIPSFPEQYVPVLHNSPSKVFSDVQTELPVFQFLLIASCPAPRHHLAASSLHILFRYTLVNLPEASRSFTGPDLLPLLTGEILQSLHHICGPSLNSLCVCILLGCTSL